MNQTSPLPRSGARTANDNKTERPEALFPAAALCRKGLQSIARLGETVRGRTPSLRTISSAIMRLIPALLLVLISSIQPACAKPDNTIEYTPLGVMITDLGEFNPKNKTFKATFYIWTVSDSANNNAIEQLRFVNANKIISSNIVTVPTKQGFWIRREICGRFLHNWNLSRFPFDHQTLTIELESSAHDFNHLRFVSDGITPITDTGLRTPGWALEGGAVYATKKIYATNFGDPRRASDNESTYARADIRINLKRIDTSSFWKMIAAGIAAAGLALASFGLHLNTSSALSPRFGLLAGSVFADVISMRSSSSELGALGYITLVDKIHILVMLYIAIATLVGLYTHWLYQAKNDAAQIKRIDGQWAVISTILLALAMSALVYHATQ